MFLFIVNFFIVLYFYNLLFLIVLNTKFNYIFLIVKC